MVIHQEFTRSHQNRDSHQPEILLAPYFLMRVTGLPFSVMEEFQFPRTAAIIEEIIALENQFEGQKERMLEDLKAAFKRVPDKEVQHKGLDLQRAIVSHNGQKARRLLPFVLSSLPAPLAQTLEAWIGYSLRHTELLAQG